MKNSFFLLALGTLLLTSCVAIRRTEFSRTERFNPQSTFKVVNGDSSDPALGLIEHKLNAHGFRVISDNIFRAPVLAGSTMVTTFDTTYNYQQYRLENFELFSGKPADYVIRYNRVIGFHSQKFHQFNASVINVQTGEVEFTYTFRQGSGLFQKSNRRILGDFARKMKNR
jgi:hypothetical protein